MTVLVGAVVHTGIGVTVLVKNPDPAAYGFLPTILPLAAWASISAAIGVVMFAGVFVDWRLVRYASTVGLFMALLWSASFFVELFTGPAIFAPWLFLFYGAAHVAFTSEIPDNPRMHDGS